MGLLANEPVQAKNKLWRKQVNNVVHMIKIYNATGEFIVYIIRPYNNKFYEYSSEQILKTCYGGQYRCSYLGPSLKLTLTFSWNVQFSDGNIR